MSPSPKLSLVTPKEEELHVNTLLYGPAKTGKTVGAASAPKPLLYLNADRPNATRFAHKLHDFDEVHVDGLTTLIATVEAIEGGKYATVVVDTVGELYRAVLEEMSNRSLRVQLQQYGDTGTHVERFCRALVEAPVNTVFVLHENPVADEASGTLERLPFTGTKNPVLAEKLMAMVDVIGYTGVVQQADEDEVKYMAQLVNGRGRRGGDRFGVLGRDREVNVEEWVALARKSVEPARKQQPKAA